MIDAVLRRVPGRLVRAIGRWQFRNPPLRWATQRYAARLAGSGVIPRGIGAGLRFDATGGQPGYLLGTTEPEEQTALANALRAGDVFYDIGAHIGFYSTIAGGIVGPTGRVYAFEPTPDSAAQARHNADLNSFKHVEIIEAGVFDAPGVMTIQPGDGSTTNRLGDGDGPKVPVIAIDAWRRENDARPPTTVMIDVEGAEMAVLRGMLDTIRKHTPTILCEVHWIGPEFGEFVDRELRPLGYTLSTLPGEEAVDLTRWHAVLTLA